MLILGSDANRQQEGEPKSSSETQRVDSAEEANHWWKHCIPWPLSHSAPGPGWVGSGSIGISGKERLQSEAPELFSFLVLSVVHPRSLHERCHSRSSHFIFYIKCNLSLSFAELSTMLSYSFVFYPCSNSIFFPFFRILLIAPAILCDCLYCPRVAGTACAARPPEEDPGRTAIRLPPPCQEEFPLWRRCPAPTPLAGFANTDCGSMDMSCASLISGPSRLAFDALYMWPIIYGNLICPWPCHSMAESHVLAFQNISWLQWPSTCGNV